MRRTLRFLVLVLLLLGLLTACADRTAADARPPAGDETDNGTDNGKGDNGDDTSDGTGDETEKEEGGDGNDPAPDPALPEGCSPPALGTAYGITVSDLQVIQVTQSPDQALPLI